MNAKEKAKLLIQFYKKYVWPETPSETSTIKIEPIIFEGNLSNAKECAIKCVNEILVAIEITTGHLTIKHSELLEVHSDIKYWQDIIKEIEKYDNNK